MGRSGPLGEALLRHENKPRGTLANTVGSVKIKQDGRQREIPSIHGANTVEVIGIGRESRYTLPPRAVRRSFFVQDQFHGASPSRFDTESGRAAAEPLSAAT